MRSRSITCSLTPRASRITRLSPIFSSRFPSLSRLTQLIGKFKDKPLDFKPGEKFKYSNSGYIVLGQIIEAASGKPYASFLKEVIFDPLQMRDSGYDNAASVLKHRASGYTRLLGLAPANSRYIHMSIPHAAGALYSTVDDLLKWDQALESEKLVSKKSLDAMFKPFKDGYGYGWSIDSKFSRSRYRHGGGINGFATIIERFPSEKLLVVCLSNLEGARVDKIGDDLAAITLEQPYVVPRNPRIVKLDPRFFEPYIGLYEEELAGGKGNREFTVSVSAGRVTIEPKGQPRLQAVPESETRFYLKPADGLAEFVKDADGSAIAIELVLGNQKIKANRVRAKEKPAANAHEKPAAVAETSPVPPESGKVIAPDRKP